MSGPWYVKTSWDRIYLMRHDLNPSTAQSECDRLNAEWERAQVPVEVKPTHTVIPYKTISDEDVKPPGEPTIIAKEIPGHAWGAVVNGKYYAPVLTLERALELVTEITERRSSSGYRWRSISPNESVESDLVDAEWPKLPVKEDIKTVVVDKDEKGNWRAVLNGKWEARCGYSKETAEIIHDDTLKGCPHGWVWHSLETGFTADLRTVLNLKG